MKTPKGWRKGQTIFNFLEWLHKNKDLSNEQSARMADPFQLSDERWDAYYEEYISFYEN